MADIFISYARSSEARARQVARALRAAGLGIWWDKELPAHRAYYEVIEERLQAARAVVVLWSEEAARSQWVRAEADVARKLNKLVQASLDGREPPIPFDQIQCARLEDWRGSAGHHEWQKVLAGIEAIEPGEPEQPTPASPSAHDRPAARSGRLAWTAGVAAAALLVGAGAFLVLKPKFGPATDDTPRVVVLPFEVLGQDASYRSFAAALEDDVAGILIENDVRILPNAEAAPLRGEGAATRLRNSGVAYAVGGTVRREGGQIRVRAYLQDVKSDVVIWSEQFVRRDTDPVGLRDAVAVAATESVAGAMDAFRQPGVRLDPQTLALFIKGANMMRSPKPLEREATLRAFDQVVTRAPEFGVGHGAYSVLLAGASRELPPAEAAAARAKARREAELAIRLHQPTSGPAYDGLYQLARMETPRDLVGAENNLLKGVGFSPTYAYIWMRECRFLVEVGRARDALRYCSKAFALRPTGGPTGYAYAHALYVVRDDVLTEQIMAKATRYNPDHEQTRRLRFEIAAFGGSVDAAAAILNDADARPRAFTRPAIAALAALLKAMRTRNGADIDSALGQLKAATHGGGMDPRYLVIGAAALDRPDTAFEAMNDPSLKLNADNGYLFEPVTAALRRDPRFWQVAKRLRLVDYWRQRNAWPDFCSEPGQAIDCRAAAAG